MRTRLLGLTAALATAIAAAGTISAADWNGDAQKAQQLIEARYAQRGVKSPEVTDTGRTFEAGGVMWRVYQVKYDGTGFRHVAVHRQQNGEYLAIEGLEKSRKWSHGVPIGR